MTSIFVVLFILGLYLSDCLASRGISRDLDAFEDGQGPGYLQHWGAHGGQVSLGIGAFAASGRLAQCFFHDAEHQANSRQSTGRPRRCPV